MTSLAASQLAAMADEPLILTEGHRYYKGALELPSLNRIMRAAGLVDDFSGVPGAILERKRQIGTAVHKACELYLLYDLDEETIPTECRSYFEGFKKYHDSIGNPKPVAVETPAYDKRHLFACTPDVVWADGIDEIKTSSRVSKYVAVQLAAQVMAVREQLECDRDGQQHRDRRCIQLKPDGTFKVTTYVQIGDFQAFESALAIYRWKESNGLLK